MLVEDIDAFTESVVSDACALLQLTAPNSTSFLTTDPRVVVCARAAYSQIENYLNRGLLFSTRYEEYFDEDTTITLRCTPVSRIRTVKFLDNSFPELLTDPDDVELLVSTTDYRLVRNKRLVIYNLDKIESIYFDMTGKLNVYVEYDGGLQDASDEAAIYNGLVGQTVANYNRTPGLGLSQIQGSGQGGGTLVMNTGKIDAGQLLDSVKILLDPYVYYGSAVAV